MNAVRRIPFFTGSKSVNTTEITYDLLRFYVQYNTSDFSYLTTTSYSDAASLLSGSNVVRVITAGTPDSNFVVAAMYRYATDPANDRIMFRDANGKIQVWENDFTPESEITAAVSYTFNQGCCYDPVNEHIYTYKNDGTVWVLGLDGSHIETLTAPVVAQQVHWYYDYINLKFYCAVQGTDTNIQVWVRSGATLVLDETLWYNARGGVCLDTVLDKVAVFDNTGTALRFRHSTLDGLDEITISKRPFTSGFIGEGIAVLPDGTLLLAEPSGFDYSIVNGNRLWQIDPLAVYRKYDRSPSMTRFSRFSGGTVSGIYDTQKITAATGVKIYSPIYDTNGFTNTENLSAWGFEFSAGGDANLTFRGSDTAPTTTPATNYYSDLPQYSDWGATTPSAEAGTPGTYRYKQAILEVKTAAASAAITVQDLIDTIAPEILCLDYDSDKMYIYTDPVSGSTNQVSTLVNVADPANSFNNGTVTTRFVKQTDYLDDESTSAVTALDDPSGIADDTTGHLIVVRRREATNTRDFIFGAGTSGSQNNWIRIMHNSSANSPASGVLIEQTDGTATIINRVYVADTALTYKRYDFISDGAAWDIKIDGVSQSLTADVGTNNGNWFGDLGATPNSAARGAVPGFNGRGRYRLFLYKTTPLTAEQSSLLDDFITQENLLA